MKNITIRYLSHGLHKTGGYRYESFLFDEICKNYQKQDFYIKGISIRKEKFFDSFFQHLYLFFWANFSAHANVNIVVTRLALPAILRNLFTKRKVIIVWHNYDKNEAKSRSLKLYYKCLFWMLSSFKMKNVQIVTGAQYWVDFFNSKINHKNKVSYFPNLFDNSFYKPFITNKKHKQIHLGQWHLKNDPVIFQLADKLNQNGFICYFSSLDASKVRKEEYYEVRYFFRFESYLQSMAESEYTIAFTQLLEGWNRVVHESILVGTSVIGFEKGGLGDLLHSSNSFIVSNAEEAFLIINQHKHKTPPDDFMRRHDKIISVEYLKSII